jgi:nicotinate-nucleotide pyrophosphorylase (carboxylating)
MDLAQEALIKDNHLLLAGAAGGPALSHAVAKVRAADPGVSVEVEVDDVAQLASALAASPDIVMLDNMTPEQVCGVTEIVERERAGAERPQLEASGNITLANVRAYAEAGADRISVGALTHSAPALDLSLSIVR